MAKLEWKDLTVTTHQQVDDADPTHWEGEAAYNGNTCRFSYHVPVYVPEEDDEVHGVREEHVFGEIPDETKDSVLAFFNR